MERNLLPRSWNIAQKVPESPEDSAYARLERLIIALARLGEGYEITAFSNAP